MRRFRCAALVPAAVFTLLLQAAPPLAAQEGDRSRPTAEEADDSIAVSALDEQFAGSGEGDGLERDAQPSGRRPRADRWSVRWRLAAMGLLQEPSGYAEGVYAGDRMKTSQRLLVRKGGKLLIGFLTDKDPGESSHADFISGVVSVGGLPAGSGITVGDFRVRAGQGMLLGSARSFGKGAAVIEPVVRDSWGLPDGLSSDETHFFRGVALQSAPGPASILLFGSARSLSARLAGDGTFLGIDESGYHRSVTEIGRRGSAAERAIGGALRWQAGERLVAGVSVLRSALELRPGADGDPPAPPPPALRGSADVRIGLAPLTLFGEIVGGGSRHPWIAGALFAPTGQARIVIVRRVLPDAPAHLRTFGFADGQTGRNEAGTYVGAELLPGGGLTVGAYIDIYARPAPVAGAFFPPVGVDRLLSVGWEPERRFAVEARFRSRTLDETAGPAGEGGLPAPANAVRCDRSIRAGVRWEPSAGVECRVRAEYTLSSSDPGGERAQGGMIFAGLRAEPVRGVSIQCRLQFFSVGSWDSRIYSVEPDLPGTLTNTALTGEGSRWYLICSVRPSGDLRCTVKFSRHTRNDLVRIGSGAGELPSNVSEKAGIQFDLML